MSKIKKIILIAIFIMFQSKNSFAVLGVGDIVFDPTSALNATAQIANLVKIVEYNVEMAKQVGNGNITPQTISWMGNWYNKCGGKKFPLPDWFPKPKLDICAGSVKSYEIGVEFYRNNYVILNEDKKNPAVVNKKIKNKEKDTIKIQTHILAKTMQQIARASKDEEVIEELNNGLKSSTDQISVQKLQTQVLINILAESQKTNESLAELKQLLFFN